MEHGGVGETGPVKKMLSPATDAATMAITTCVPRVATD